jgi:hypothetical protein
MRGRCLRDGISVVRIDKCVDVYQEKGCVSCTCASMAAATDLREVDSVVDREAARDVAREG